MGWLATVWSPDAEAIRSVGPEWTRAALADQGIYHRGTPFDVLLGGSGPAPQWDRRQLGEAVWAWNVTDRTVINASVPPVVTMVSLMRRLPSTNHGEFVDHWSRKHAPLAVRRHVGLVDYRQLVVTETLTTHTPEIDGIALLGFATRHDFEHRFFDSDEGRAEIMADVARFMDRPGRETTLVGPPDEPVKPG